MNKPKILQAFKNNIHADMWELIKGDMNKVMRSAPIKV